MKHQIYKKDVSHLNIIDVYRVLDLWNVNNPAIQHAIKKLLNAGQRGSKDFEHDLREAIDSIERALEMAVEDRTDSPWIAWDGSADFPDIPIDTVVGLVLQDGTVYDCPATRDLASHWDWKHDDSGENIVAYKIFNGENNT